MAIDEDRTKGSMKQMTGSVKEGAGRVLGDSKLEGDGKADRTEGKLQNFIGGLKDMFRGKRT